MIEAKQIIVPIVLFIFIAVVVVIALSLLFKYLNRRLALETVKQVMSKDQHIDSVLIKSIVKENSYPNADLRKGLLLLAITIATILLGYILDMMGLIYLFNALLGMAAFPGLIGITYILFHFFIPSKDS